MTLFTKETRTESSSLQTETGKPLFKLKGCWLPTAFFFFMLIHIVIKSWEHMKSAVVCGSAVSLQFPYWSVTMTDDQFEQIQTLEQRGGILMFSIFTRCFCSLCVTHSKLGFGLCNDCVQC